ncbi:30S ribosomal protein S12 methylthiotransferase RimO [Helicobacter muridarum]|uniref:Ribosomal protein uS12 methylthiotransferase RimO n=1 Tax=Helicobacter muridarum TaxID=216 RepID=A0A099U1I7_9HELI|nr:30S ribosomal protein S12 methylthiotransferase RimO [Helicobacter muridarum]TLE00045.1 30S ribosomal protein S12 methylthiotransferase RimO [Helicobacter muridarum]STQ86108.1 MiaB-like tRNA modifying enzyme YliG [Helicobacter muridarum]
MQIQKKLHVISLGCSKNLVDSEVMLGRLTDYAMTNEIGEADVIIINTCGFIEAAKKESLGHIFEALQRRKEGALLVASGCLVARYAKEIKDMIPEIDILTGVSDYHRIDSMIAQKRSIANNGVFLYNQEKRVITGSNIHAFVKISEGCNQNCSFCAIPSFKGRLQSRGIDSILHEIEMLAGNGYYDISFIAQDSSSYLRDKNQKDGLLKLIQAIEAQGAIKSARILYLYPNSTNFELIDKIAQSSIFQNYYDMPIQHISTNVLQSMQRSHNNIHQLLTYMRNVPHSFVRSSVIVGYPNESEDDFTRLCDFVEEFGFDRLNIFEFSKEEGTKAGLLEELPKNIRSKRINALNKIVKKQQDTLFKDMVGQNLDVIIEGKSEISEYFYSARDKKWAIDIDGEILINDGDFQGTGYYCARITDYKDGILVGRII